MESLDFQDDPYLRVLRPLVESYLACWREGSRHIRSMRLTPCQFDVIATLGDTEGMTCAELSAATLVTKGTLLRKTFAAHAAFLRPYFARALSRKEAEQTKQLLLRIRDCFLRQGGSSVVRFDRNGKSCV